MNKEEMKLALAQGNKVRHKYFGEKEFVMQLPDGTYQFEDGNTVPEELFWEHRTDFYWDKDWEIIQVPFEENIHRGARSAEELAELDALAESSFSSNRRSDMALLPYLLAFSASGLGAIPSLGNLGSLGNFGAGGSSSKFLYGSGTPYKEVEYRHSGARRKFKKINRNASCPCGSGKKYKECCIGKDLTKIIKKEEVQNVQE